MYPAWAYVFPTTILRLPYSLLCATLWCCIVYYPVGLAPEPGRQAISILCLLGTFSVPKRLVQSVKIPK